ncbi:IS3-like element ISVisp1 family transposase [Vibrio splendidus]|uniref:IS3-like element ISVisp1 family transposase n=3 Tax=Vibrio splendidus TaxID=29497 RepID=UPI0039A6BF3B
MPAYKSGKKTQQYLTEFKVTAVRLSLREGATVKSVALSLDIHPYMLSKWRKDYREGVIMEDKRKKRTQIPSQKTESSRIAELERQNEQLKLENDLPKKVATIRCPRKSTKFRFIAHYKTRYSIVLMCRFLSVSKSGYYVWLDREPSRYDQEEQALKKRIIKVFTQSRETYGSPRVHAELRRQGVLVSRKRVARIMREQGLRARSYRIYMKMAKLHRFYQSIKNIKKDTPKPTAVNQQWSGDLTYIKQGKRWMYLAVVIDLYSRKIVGWSLGSKKSTQLTMSSLRMAIRNRKPKERLLFHTDRGSEYRAHEVQALLSKNGIVPSMNRPGHCTDNAEVESFFHTLKGDIIRKNSFKSEKQLRDKLAGYIQHFYNRYRLHSSLGYRTPHEYEVATG